jgi:hypothetical protein
MTMSVHGSDHTRRLKAAIIGLGLDGPIRPLQIVQSQECVLIGGSETTRAELIETMLRLETELERRGRTLGEIAPDELEEIAWRIDSPELHEIARSLQEGLRRDGRAFPDASPEELTRMATRRETSSHAC